MARLNGLLPWLRGLFAFCSLDFFGVFGTESGGGKGFDAAPVFGAVFGRSKGDTDSAAVADACTHDPGASEFVGNILHDIVLLQIYASAALLDNQLNTDRIKCVNAYGVVRELLVTLQVDHLVL